MKQPHAFLRRRRRSVAAMAAAACGTALSALSLPSRADVPAMLDPNLQVTTVLNQRHHPADRHRLPRHGQRLPGAREGLGPGQAGHRRRDPAAPVLDLAVNSNSERGLLSMALHPNFPGDALRLHPLDREQHRRRLDRGGRSAAAGQPGRSLHLERRRRSTLDQQHRSCLRARQTDNVAVPGHPGTEQRQRERQPQRRRHALRAGRQALHLYMGDLGRRGWMQNLPNGPFLTAPQVDDTFGGPAPDNAHLTGVILRLNDDGTTPADNPFFAAGAAIGGEVGANIQKIYLLRPSQRLRHGVRPAVRRAVGDRERRRRLQRAQPRRPGHERRLDPVRRPAQPVRRLQVHRDDAVRQRPAAGPLSADAGRVQRGRRRLATVHAAGRRLRRSGAQLAVRDRPGRDRRSSTATPSGPSTTARFGSARPAASSRSAATAAACTASSSRPTGCTSTSAPTRGWPTASPTTSSEPRSSTAPRARPCRSARASASRPTSSRGRTATSTSSRTPTTRSTGSAGVPVTRAPRRSCASARGVSSATRPANRRAPG